MPILNEAANFYSDMHLFITLYINYYIYNSKETNQKVRTICSNLVTSIYYELTTQPNHIKERAKSELNIIEINESFQDLLRKYDL